MTKREKNAHLDHLQAYTIADWQPLFDLIPAIEQSKPETEDDLILRFYHTVYNTPDIVIAFNWSRWNEGKAVLNSDQPKFDTYDLLTLCLFVTTIVRADRFNGGFLDRCYRQGIILGLLRMIARRVNEAHAIV